MPPTAELAGAALGSAALNGGVCLQRLANPGNSLLMPVMMKFTPSGLGFILLRNQ
jgi:hypothetical protein